MIEYTTDNWLKKKIEVLPENYSCAVGCSPYCKSELDV